MGCTPSKQIIYSIKEENSEVLAKQIVQGKKQENSFIHPDISDYSEYVKTFQNISVIGEVLKSFDKNPNMESLGYRKPINEKECEKNYTFFKLHEIKSYAETLSKNLVLNGLCPTNLFSGEGTFSFLGIFARNCFEWVLSDLACQMNKITSVTFYATLGDVAFEYISQQTKLSTICVSPENVNILISYIKKYNIKSIENVILFDFTLFCEPKHTNALEDIGINVFSLKKLIEKNEFTEKMQLNISEPDTILTLCYTSGTTGIPKGAKISQRNLIAAILTVFQTAKVSYGMEDSILIYLPLAHIMERLNISASLVYCVKTGFISGDVRTSLTEDIEILKPTIFLAVPRVLQTFRAKILETIEKLEEGCKKNTALRALRVKRENFSLDNNNITHTIYDKLVFSKIREKFGGRIKYFVTGSAPITEELVTDIKIIFSCPVIEGYGLTECCAGCSIMNFSDSHNDCCGGPISSVKIKLIDVPEMNYNSTTLLNGEPSPTGEICIYGPTVFKGYFLNQNATNETLDSEGWFYTGDIGRILPHNRGLKIIDRKKEIFKLAQGEYIAPSKLESIYGKSRFVVNVCIYGNSFKTYLIAILVPNKEAIFEFLLRRGLTSANNLKEITNLEQFYKNQELVAEIKADFDRLAKESNFNSLEKINKFYLSEKEFTIQNGCLTATLKLARNTIFKEFEKEIQFLYQE